MAGSAMISPDPLDEAREGMAADRKAAIAVPDRRAAEEVGLRPAPAYPAAIPGAAIARADRIAGVIDRIGRRGGRSR